MRRRRGEPNDYRLPRRTSCCAEFGWKLAEILYAVPTKSAMRIGRSSPKIFMSTDYLLPSTFIVNVANYHPKRGVVVHPTED
jgi:hypothetical protein